MLGVIADDLTGATDIADVLVGQGFRTAVFPGAARTGSTERGPHRRDVNDLDAVVIALKSRTAAVRSAVESSVAAARQLLAVGCDRLYFKYCSTFDSTPDGNIGPVMDELLELFGADATVVQPAYPAAGRTVYRGHLFVGDQLLDECGMRHHPLTPMRSSDLRSLLRPQSRSRLAAVPLSTVRGGDLVGALSRLAERPDRALPPIAIVVDAIEDDDLRALAAATDGWPLLTGSAGLAAGLIGPRWAGSRVTTAQAGRRVVLCGSASAASRAQVGHAAGHVPTAPIDLAALAQDPGAECTRLVDWVLSMPENVPAVVYAVGPDDPPVDAGAATGTAAAIERCLADIAVGLVRHGLRRLIAAGGETSGAVVSRLDVERLRIGARIATGVPWTAARLSDGTELALVLKSGNFGQPDFFTTAWKE